MPHKKESLRLEKSMSCSGNLNETRRIPLLKNEDYIIRNVVLDGDAPKQFIKAYIYVENSTVKKSVPKSWCSYIAKTAEKWYPHESVIEFMINRIGQVLGLKMNDIHLVTANKQIRFLSKYFLKKDEKLIHGAEICGEYLEDEVLAKQIAIDKKTARDLFTFEFMKDAIRTVFPDNFEHLMCDLVKMLCFDGLVGNNDRHFYNWGIIQTLKRTGKKPTFAPIYDSARGLLWNESDDDIKKDFKTHKQNGKKVVNYVKNASPRISIDENKQANHFQLIDFINRISPHYSKIIASLSSAENEEKVLKMLKKEFYPFFIFERCELITLILRERFKTIREIKI